MAILMGRDACTGCLACYNVCPKNAIQVVSDEKGFVYPEIDGSKCISCGLCQKTCFQPIKSVVEITNVYSCSNRNEEILLNSTSGGIFYSLAYSILETGGVVFGAAFDKDFNVIHKHIDSVEEIQEFMGSKYVQSYIGLSYREVQNFLKDGRKVLFSGTPCQVDGLKRFLNKNYDNLLCIDILCHCAPSPAFYKKYRDMILDNHREKGELRDIRFRFKNPGWSNFSMRFEFEHGVYQEDKYHDPYLRAFLKNCISRKSCHSCHYCRKERVGDISLGDFWGYWSLNREKKNTDKGISLVMINSLKGKMHFEGIVSEYVSVEQSYSTAAAGNRVLYGNYKPNECSDGFWNDFDKMSVDSLVEKYLGKKDKVSVKHHMLGVLRDYAFLLPPFVRKKLKSRFVPNRE